MVRKMFGTKTKTETGWWRKCIKWGFITCAAHLIRNDQNSVKGRNTGDVTDL